MKFDNKVKLGIVLLFMACLILVSVSSVCADDSVTNFTQMNKSISEGKNVSLAKDINGLDEIQNGIEINRNTTVDGQGYSIDAQGKDRFFRITNSSAVLTLKNITLKNGYTTGDGGAIYSTEDINLILENNVLFDNNTAIYNGGAIYSDSGLVNITSNGNVTFSNNKINSDESYGGAICTSGHVIINSFGDILFDNNTAGNGGAICSFNGGLVNITSNGTVTFRNNKAISSSGGAIRTTGNVIINATGNVLFDNNTASSMGGAIHSTDLVNITSNGNVTFSNNKVNSSSGGAINANTNVIINATGNVLFDNNTAGTSGGAIYSDSGLVNITSNGKVTFTNNKANSSAGGAIYASTKVIINSFDNILFDNNIAGSGGAIYSDSGLVNITSNGKVTFTNNKANSSAGGAIRTHTNVIIINTTGDILFDNNTAGTSGGAIYSEVLVNITSTNEDVTFSNNKANSGAGGAIYASTKVIINSFDNILFDNNTAGNGGGAIYSDGLMNITSTNEDVTFSNNKANSSVGGAIRVSGNVVINATGNVLFTNNTAGGIGGAIFTMRLVNITSTNEDVTFSNNKANSSTGGAIFSMGNVYIISNNDILFDNNIATGTRGQIPIEGGGGIYACNPMSKIPSFGNVTLNSKNGDVIFKNNKANGTDGYGGGILAGNVNITANKVTFTNNNATQAGGAIYSMGKVTLNNALFSNNNATIGSTIYTKDIELNNTKIESKSNISPIYITNKAYFDNNTFTLLNNDNIAPIAFNGTSITSKVIVLVNNNNTEYIKQGSKTQINVTFYDDNNNIITVLNNTLANVTLNKTSIGYLVNNGLKSNITYNADTEGTYLVNVISTGLNNMSIKTAILIVNNKNTTGVNISGVLSNTTSGGYIIVKLNPDATGNVTITINGTNYTKELINGIANITIPVLSSENNLLLNYTGDNKYNPIIRSYEITVPKVTEYNVNVTGELNSTGSGGNINITLPSDANGNITITIKGKTYNATVVNGKAIINNVMELVEGNNTIIIKYFNDNKYNETIRSITFNVKPNIRSFIDLQKIIDENSNIKLETNYTYLKNKDKGSLIINKNIIIDGNGYSIDAKGLVDIFTITSNGNLTLKNINLNNALSYCIVNYGVLDLTNVKSNKPIYNKGVITSGVIFHVGGRPLTTYDSFIVTLKTVDGISIKSGSLVFSDDQGHTYKTYMYDDTNGFYVCYIPVGVTGYVTFGNVVLSNYPALVSKGCLNISKYPKTSFNIDNFVKTAQFKVMKNINIKTTQSNVLNTHVVKNTVNKAVMNPVVKNINHFVKNTVFKSLNIFLRA